MFFLPIIGLGQSIELAPVRASLPSKSVRAIHKDMYGRLWIGTDLGIEANLSLSSPLQNIRHLLRKMSIWAVESTDSVLIVGSRLNGLYLFDLTNGELIHHFDTNVINQIRKIRIVKEKIFVLTNKGCFLLEGTNLTPIPLSESSLGGFIIDVFEFKGGIYAANYFPSTFLEYKSAHFSRVSGLKYPFADNFHTAFRAFQLGDSIAFCSGGFGGFLSFLTASGEVKQNKDQQLLLNGMVAWDMVRDGNDLWICIGNVNTSIEGYLVHFNIKTRQYSKIKTDYLQCLYFDTDSKTLLLGTQNSGIMSVPIKIEEMPNSVIQSKESIQKILGNAQREVTQYLGDDYWIFGAGQFERFDVRTSKSSHFLQPDRIYPILGAEIFRDTTFLFESYGYVKYFDQHIFRKYHDLVTSVPIGVKTQRELYILNKERDFISLGLDGITRFDLDDRSILFADDFTVVDDELFVLFQGRVNIFKIDRSKRVVKQKGAVPKFPVIEGFTPIYVFSWRSNLVLVGKDGCLIIDPRSFQPVRFNDFGSFQLEIKPGLKGDTLFTLIDNAFIEILHLSNETTRGSLLAIEGLKPSYQNGDPILITMRSLGFGYERRLKKVELFMGGNLVSQTFTINNEVDLNKGLKSGEYRLLVSDSEKSNEIFFSIEYPAATKVLFWLIASVVLIAILISVRLIILRKVYARKIEENRLELLKHQLNPHFVYNSLNLISALVIENRNEEAVQAIADFAKLQRAFLETNGKAYHSLEEEFEFLNVYIKMFKRRFSDSNEFYLSITRNEMIDLNEYYLPPLLLQPIVENALKYGVSEVENSEIQVVDNIGVSNSISVIIKNFKNAEIATQGGRFGIANIIERIKLYNWLNQPTLSFKIDEDESRYSFTLIILKNRQFTKNK